MNTEEVTKLYEKERSYQRDAFGEYQNNPSLNLASFLEFLDDYVKRAKEEYVTKWTPSLPPWLKNCKEQQLQGSAPVRTYEHLVKIMTLAGAALEAYADINIEEWRSEGVKSKWREHNELICKPTL